MNWNDRMNAKQRLMDNLAKHMLRKGTIRSDRSRSNYYASMRIVELSWRGYDFTITQVDGMTCLIQKASGIGDNEV